MENNESPELIEQKMQATRNALTEKVALLEEQVVDTMQSATSAVQTTVESVKDTMENVKSVVSETVTTVKESVRDTLDISAHVRANPWAMVGGAALTGFATGLFLLGGHRKEMEREHGFSRVDRSPQPEPVRAVTDHSRPSWLDRLMERAGDELYKLGESALNQALASLQQQVHQGVPQLIEQVQQRLVGDFDRSNVSHQKSTMG